MNEVNSLDSNVQFVVEPDIVDILFCLRKTNPDKRRELKSTATVITVDQVQEAAELSILFQKMKLCEKHIDTLNLSNQSSALVPSEALKDLTSSHDLREFDYINNDPGLFLVRQSSMNIKNIRRWSRYHFLIINDFEQIEEIFTCLGRYFFFREWRWLLHAEFIESKLAMKKLSEKLEWPLVETEQI